MSASIDQASLGFAKAMEAEIQSKQLFLDKSMPNDFSFVIHDQYDDPYVPPAVERFSGRRRDDDEILSDDETEDDEILSDHLRDDEVFLTREFNGEKIKVKVKMPYFSSYDDSNRYASGSGCRRRLGAKKSDSDRLDLIVEISKGRGRKGRKSYFNVYAVAGNVTVESMKVHVPSDEEPFDEERSYFYDLEEYIVDKKSNLQRALREYLKARGIEKSTTDFLYDYMLRKSQMQPSTVLKKVLQFLED